MAIGIKVKTAEGDYDLAASKFFGAPTIPLAWDGQFYDDEIFLCQIRLADIAHLDVENKLPHTGYLYFFVHTDGGYYNLQPDVRYSPDEPGVAVDGFNAVVAGYEQFTEAYLMEFYPVDDDQDCTRLLGEPSDWNYPNNPPPLLLQYDPLDNDMGFLDFLDGFVYFFFGEDQADLTQIVLHTEFS